MTRSLASDETNRQTLETEANELLAKYKRFIKPGATYEPPAPAPEPAAEPKPEGEEGAEEAETAPTVVTEYRDAIHAMDAHLVSFHKLGTIKALQPGAFAFVAIMLIAVPAVIGLFAAGTVGAIGGGVGGLVLAVLLFLGLSAIAKKGVTKVAVPLRYEVERAARLAEEAKAWLEADHQAKKDAVENRRESELKRAEDELAKRTAAAEERLGTERTRVEAMYPPMLADLAGKAGEALKAAEEKWSKKLVETKTAAEAALKKLDEDHAVKAKAHAEAVAQHWEGLLKRWTEGSAAVMQDVAAIHADNDRLFPEWKDGWKGWDPPQADPPGVRFGEFEVKPGKLPNGTPEDERLKPVGPTDFVMPALLDFQGKGSLLIRSGEDGRDKAVDLLQAVMLRLLTAIPPGASGSRSSTPSASARTSPSFMHLIDYDEVLVSQRIWTDTGPDRPAARRPDRAHGERHPDVPPQRVRDDRGIQRPGRRGRRAVPHPRRSPTSRPRLQRDRPQRR